MKLLIKKLNSRFLLLIIGLISLYGCAHPLDRSDLPNREHYIENNSSPIEVTLDNSLNTTPAELAIQFLGVGGFSFEVNNETIITAPSYSNPHLLKNFPGVSINVKEKQVKHLFPKSLKNDSFKPKAERVKGVLIGHSHYDHLLDVPFIMNHYLKDAEAFGSTTAAAILNNFGISCHKGGRAMSVNQHAEKQMWIDIPDTHIRILPIKSSHAPHFLEYTAQKGYYKCGENFKLRTAWDWKMGNVYAYLIDFRNDSNEILYRVYYQDSANQPDQGLISKGILAERAVDVAILTLAGSGNVDYYPLSRVENTKAELFIVGHWEDFFDNFNKAPAVARRSDANTFFNDLEQAMTTVTDDSQWVIPNPLDKIIIKRAGQ